MASRDIVIGLRPRSWLRRVSPWLLCPAAFALAYFSPIEDVRSDPAIALLATQSLLDHGTLRLDAYLDDPDCVYDLEHDYRIRRRDGSFSYYAHGVSLVSLPAVWLANRAGYHMLDPSAEHALQNLLSALCCALLGPLLYGLCRVYLGPAASFAIAAVSLFGSSLLSTLATALWNASYEISFLGLGLLHLARRQAGGRAPSSPYLALLGALALMCRPTAAFAVLAAILVLAPAAFAPAAPDRGQRQERSFWLLLGLGLALLFVVLATLDLTGWMPRYYSPLKLTPQTPLPTGLYGALLSPSRGLLVFSPFLAVVAAACLKHLRALAGDRLFRLAALWSALQVLAIATKGIWWGGHAYGPRLLAEVMLPATLATCLAWRLLERHARPRARILFAAAYLILGMAAILIHSYQGLFNPQTRRWNFSPNVDQNPRLAFDWRHPQFLASESSLADRAFELERRRLGTYELGREIGYDGRGALLRDWYPPEPGWRWSRGRAPEIRLLLGELAATGDLYLFRLRAAPLGRQEVGLTVNGIEVGRIELDGPQVRERALAFERDLLAPGRENVLRFDLPGAASTATDARVLGLALRSFSLGPRAATGVGVDDEPLFAHGFGASEGRWRWTDGRRATVDVPVAGTATIDTLELTASALERQPVGIRLNGTPIGELDFEAGFGNVVTRRLTFNPALLRPYRMNQVELSLPAARPTADDARLLGLAFVRLELR